MKVDFLLIGGGLAGLTLAYRLQQAGKVVQILDTPGENQSSQIAAGLYNPVTGRKMVKTWLADTLFEEIEPFYREMEKLSGEKFLHPSLIYRPFLSIEEQNEWMGKSSEEVYLPYIQAIHRHSQSLYLKDPEGGVLVKNSGWLDLPLFMKAMKAYFGSVYTVRKIEEDRLSYEEGRWIFDEIEAEHVVFCTGVQAANSSFFGFLPFAPVKGEILEVNQAFCPEYIVNRGVFRIHLGNGVHRVGATYTKHDLDCGTTAQAARELLDRLDGLVNVPSGHVVSHKFGIRPATRDRKPFLGKHPSVPNVYIFNGFGAKGVSFVPYFSKIMCAYLVKSSPIPAEVDIARYFHYL